jgi:hypothetical protein
VNQTVRDCLEEAMDIDGLGVLGRIHRGARARGARHRGSVLAHDPQRQAGALSMMPLEERRSHAVQTRRAGESIGSVRSTCGDPCARRAMGQSA